MAVTLTPNYNFQKPAKGDAGWWSVMNANFDSIDAVIAAIETTMTDVLHVGRIHINTTSGTTPMTNTAGVWIMWNRLVGQGASHLVNHRGTATGGFIFETTTDAVTFERLADFNQTFGEAQTSLLLSRMSGGVRQVHRVSCGAVNSGGAGARMLTIAN